VIHIHDAVELPDFDAGFCRGSMVPVQDPVFPTIRRDRFAVDADDIVQIPEDWKTETKQTRGPQLHAAAAERLMAYLGDTPATPPEKLAQHQTEMVGTVLTHVHVYAIMTITLRALGEEERLQTIRSYETGHPAAHPSYVKAWQVVIGLEHDSAALGRVIAEAR
jgi:hypothetical protein